MTLNEQEQAYVLALMETYGATFDFYYRIDSYMAEDERRFNPTTERVGLLEAINSGVRFELSEKIKESLSEPEEVHTYKEYTEEELEQAYKEMYGLKQTEEELWEAGVTVEN